jgi:hypothetical protein
MGEKKTYREEGNMKMEAEIGMMWPQAKQAKECLPEAGRGNQQNLPLCFGGKEALLTDTLLSDFWPPEV